MALSTYQALCDALLAVTPALRPEDLPATEPENREKLVYDWLYPALSEKSRQDGYFMQYVEWKEPQIDLNQFKAIQELGLSFNTEEILAPVYDSLEASYQEHENNGGDEDYFFSFHIDMRMNENEIFFMAYNQALEPHNLCLIDLNTGLSDNSFLLLVQYDERKISALRQAFEDLGLTTLF